MMAEPDMAEREPTQPRDQAEMVNSNEPLEASMDDGFPFGNISGEPAGRTVIPDTASLTALAIGPRFERQAHLARRRATRAQVRRLIVHPVHLVALGSVFILALVNWSLAILIAGAFVDVVLIAALPLLRLVRESLDASREEARCAEALKAREALVARLCARHRSDLAAIDRLVGRTRESDRERGIEIRSMLDDGLTRLSDSYIRLALAHRACEEVIATTNPIAVEETIRVLEKEYPQASDGIRPALKRRLTIAYRRLACCERAQHRLELIGQQLAAIVDLVHLMHQQAIAPATSPDPDAELDHFIRELDESEIAVREIDRLGALGEEARECEPVPRVA